MMMRMRRMMMMTTVVHMRLWMFENWRRTGGAMYIKYIFFLCTMWAFLILFITVDSSRQGLSTRPDAILHSLSQAESLMKPYDDLPDDVSLWTSSTTAATRRLLIGSTAPVCTYNECRGCKTKCKAEQVPVDANDPLNSAYHYKCVCHK